MDIRKRDASPAFTLTKDGSEIRELLGAATPAAKQSLAEAAASCRASIDAALSSQHEEIYYILSGEGRMRIIDDVQSVGPGDAIAIPPGV